MREDGLGIVVEVTSDYEIAVAIQGLLGNTLDIDSDDRIYGAYFSHEQLLKLFEEAGFRLLAFQVPFSTSLFISCP